MTQYLYVLIKQESHSTTPPAFAIAVTPHDQAANPPDDEKKYIYSACQFTSSPANKKFNIKARFTKGVSTGIVLAVFNKHDEALEHLQKIQLGEPGGDWGDVEKSWVHLRADPYLGHNWYVQVEELVIPGTSSR